MKTWHVVVALACAQAAIMGGWFFLPKTQGSTEPGVSIGSQIPALTVFDREAREHSARVGERTMVLHVWATWCPPCRDELPTLVYLQSRGDLDTFVIALDSDWQRIDSVLPPTLRDVYRADPHQVESMLRVDTLPVTFVVSPSGGVMRFDGSRDWSNATFVEAALRDAAHRAVDL